MNRVFIAALAMGLLWVTSAYAAPDEIEVQAQKLERELIAPCCYTGTVAQHQSGISWQMRQEIRAKLKAGATPDQIKAGYVQQYGKEVLVPEPPIALYIVGAATLMLGLGIVVVVIRRFTATAKPAPVVASQEVIARIERELRLGDTKS